ncbi:MAG: tripartite tricarboxylate transporter substrate binding protein [Burkholderiales bacterium]
MKRWIVGTIAAVASALVLAQEVYPNRAVKIVVPFAPGGATDITARLIGEKLQAKWGQPVVIENHPGAGGNVGSDLVAKAKPDGYTLLVGVTGSHAINTSLMKSMPYDPLKDFEPLTLATIYPNAIVVNAKVPASTLPELIALLKAKPATYSYGSDGNGTASHLTMELLKAKSGVKITHVPYKGGGPMVTDLLGGQIQVGITGLPAVQQHLKAGTLKLIAITTPQRMPAYPAYPTIAEQGFPGFAAAPWAGFFAPKGTPQPIVLKVSGALVEVMAMPDVQQKMQEMGSQLVPNSPAEFRKFVEDEIAKWSEAVKVSGASVD